MAYQSKHLKICKNTKTSGYCAHAQITQHFDQIWFYVTFVNRCNFCVYYFLYYSLSSWVPCDMVYSNKFQDRIVINGLKILSF